MVRLKSMPPEDGDALDDATRRRLEGMAPKTLSRRTILRGAGTAIALPLLDNSMVVYGSGISDGDRHNHDDLPILLAGGAGGRIKTGRHIRKTGRRIRYKNRTPLCNLYVWMMQQMGVKADRIGDNNGVLDKLG